MKKFRSTLGFEGVCSAVRFGSVRFLTSVLVVEAEEPLKGCGRGDKAALFALGEIVSRGLMLSSESTENGRHGDDHFLDARAVRLVVER